MQQTPKRERTRRLAGFTLVELMVSLLIVGIVMMGWWRIMNATSPYREAQRRAAVEVAAGMLDIFPAQLADSTSVLPTRFRVNANGNFSEDSSGVRQCFPQEWFPAESPVRYTMELVAGTGEHEWTRWDMQMERIVPLSKTLWLVVDLFDGEDAASHPVSFTQLKQVVSAVY